MVGRRDKVRSGTEVGTRVRVAVTVTARAGAGARPIQARRGVGHQRPVGVGQASGGGGRGGANGGLCLRSPLSRMRRPIWIVRAGGRSITDPPPASATKQTLQHQPGRPRSCRPDAFRSAAHTDSNQIQPLRPIGSGPPASVRGARALDSARRRCVGIVAILQAAAAALRSAMNAATQRWFALAGRELARDVRMTRWRELLRVWRVGRVEPRTHGA